MFLLHSGEFFLHFGLSATFLIFGQTLVVIEGPVAFHELRHTCEEIPFFSGLLETTYLCLADLVGGGVDLVVLEEVEQHLSPLGLDFLVDGVVEGISSVKAFLVPVGALQLFLGETLHPLVDYFGVAAGQYQYTFRTDLTVHLHVLHFLLVFLFLGLFILFFYRFFLFFFFSVLIVALDLLQKELLGLFITLGPTIKHKASVLAVGAFQLPLDYAEEFFVG